MYSKSEQFIEFSKDNDKFLYSSLDTLLWLVLCYYSTNKIHLVDVCCGPGNFYRSNPKILRVMGNQITKITLLDSVPEYVKDTSEFLSGLSSLISVNQNVVDFNQATLGDFVTDTSNELVVVLMTNATGFFTVNQMNQFFSQRPRIPGVLIANFILQEDNEHEVLNQNPRLAEVRGNRYRLNHPQKPDFWLTAWYREGIESFCQFAHLDIRHELLYRDFKSERFFWFSFKG